MIETPYKKAKQVWDNRIGNARLQAFNWRLFALSMAAINAMLVVFLFVQSMKSEVVPYIVEVDAGRARAVGLARGYSPNEAVTKYFIKNFINNVRSLTSDVVVVRKNWTEAYRALTVPAAKILEQVVAGENPLKKVGTITKTVDIHSVLNLSKESFQADWTEYTFDKHGKQRKSERFRGVLKVVFLPPKSEDDIKRNPLGIFLDHFSWQVI